MVDQLLQTSSNGRALSLFSHGVLHPWLAMSLCVCVFVHLFVLCHTQLQLVEWEEEAFPNWRKVAEESKSM